MFDANQAWEIFNECGDILGRLLNYYAGYLILKPRLRRMIRRIRNRLNQ